MNGPVADPYRAPDPAFAVEPRRAPETAPLADRFLAPAPVIQAEPAAVAAPLRAPAAPQPAPPRRTCLIVDDSRVVRKVSRRIVEEIGYTVIEAENGEEALARCKAAMPDLILLDWDMPVMTGLEFISQLRSLPGKASPKTVFCTARTQTLDIYKGIEAGADEYVAKPFDEASLIAKLQRIGAA